MASLAISGNHDLHLIFEPQFHFFQMRFEEEIFRIEVGLPGELLKLLVVSGMLLRQTLELRVVRHQVTGNFLSRNWHPLPPDWKLGSHAAEATTNWYESQAQVRVKESPLRNGEREQDCIFAGI